MKKWFTTESHTLVFYLLRLRLGCVLLSAIVASLFFCARVLPEVLIASKTAAGGGHTEFPTMLGTQYAFTRHTVQQQRADLSAAGKTNNPTLPVMPPFSSLRDWS